MLLAEQSSFGGLVTEKALKEVFLVFCHKSAFKMATVTATCPDRGSRIPPAPLTVRAHRPSALYKLFPGACALRIKRHSHITAVLLSLRYLPLKRVKAEKDLPIFIDIFSIYI